MRSYLLNKMLNNINLVAIKEEEEEEENGYKDEDEDEDEKDKKEGSEYSPRSRSKDSPDGAHGFTSFSDEKCYI